MLKTHWRPLGAHAPGTWFIVGDVHGQWTAYKTLLETFGAFETTTTRTLLTLGDLVDKGPKSIKCLKATLGDKAQEKTQTDRHIRLWGNHEIMMVEALRSLETPAFKQRMDKWVLSGADSVLEQISSKGSRKKKAAGLAQTLGVDLLSRFAHWKGTYQEADLRFAHAGYCPQVGFTHTATLSAGDLWVEKNGLLVKHKRHWASIREPFLEHRGPKDSVFFHGHSIPKRLFYAPIRSKRDLYYVLDKKRTHGRICLDGGAGKSMGVAGAIIHNNKYQLLYSPINRSG